MYLRSQLHCCAFSWPTGILALSHIPLVYLQFQLQMLWIVLDKLEFMLMVSSLKWPTCLHAFCLRVFTKTLKTAPFLCKHRLEVNSKWRGVDTFRARLQWEARVTAKYPGCPFFTEMESGRHSFLFLRNKTLWQHCLRLISPRLSYRWEGEHWVMEWLQYLNGPG